MTQFRQQKQIQLSKGLKETKLEKRDTIFGTFTFLYYLVHTVCVRLGFFVGLIKATLSDFIKNAVNLRSILNWKNCLKSSNVELG